MDGYISGYTPNEERKMAKLTALFEKESTEKGLDPLSKESFYIEFNAFFKFFSKKPAKDESEEITSYRYNLLSKMYDYEVKDGKRPPSLKMERWKKIFDEYCHANDKENVWLAEQMFSQKLSFEDAMKRNYQLPFPKPKLPSLPPI